MTLNFTEICRLCMTRKENLTPLFHNEASGGMSLSAKIMYFVPVLQLCADDDLPSQVCQKCSRLVNLSYKFKLQCENSDTTLRQYLETNSLQDNKQGIVHSAFKSDVGDNWVYKIEKVDIVEDSYDADFDDQYDSDGEKRPTDLSERYSENEWKNVQLSSALESNINIEDGKGKIECAISKPEKKIDKIRSAKLSVGKIKKQQGMLSSKKKSDKNTITNVISKISNVSDKPLTSYIVQDKDEIKKGDCVKKSKARTRGEKKGFLCQDCGKNFSYEQHLLLHRRSHTGEKPFSCSVCSERFSVSSNLNKHMRIHTGEKPFLCTVCGKNFSRSDTLSKHMRSHTGEKPFHCAVCGNNFGRRSILTNHMRTHSGEKPYLCTECGQRFAQSYDLTKHTRSHTGEKPYHCTLCRMSFGQRNSLTKHMNSHPKEMPFPCLDFSKGFPYKMDSTKLLSHTEPVKLLAHSCKY
ncbi:zinc finger protein 3-like [Periplaneta americana]|uniref:zinc finger protein 3-like n=1 Tax=Periplaneta americana TaxID=6978 RepID=UPI0037E96332